MLDVLIVKKLSRLQVPGAIGKYKNGQYKQLDHLATYYKTDRIVIRCDKPTPVNVDGELLTPTVVDMSIAPEKGRFCYPKGLSWAVKEEAKV